MGTGKYFRFLAALLLVAGAALFPAICRASWTSSADSVEFNVTSANTSGLHRSITFTRGEDGNNGTVHFRISDLALVTDPSKKIDDRKVTATINGVEPDKDNNGYRKLWQSGQSNTVTVTLGLSPDVADYQPGKYRGTLSLDQNADCAPIEIIINIQPFWITISPGNIDFYADNPGRVGTQTASVVIHTVPLKHIRVSLHVPSLKHNGIEPREITPERCTLNVSYTDWFVKYEKDFSFTSSGSDPVIFSSFWNSTSFLTTGIYDLALRFYLDIDSDIPAGTYSGQYILTVDEI